MNKEQFAEKIIRLRKKKGYTQAQLAELLNVSNKAVSRWETAEGYPDITLLKPLSEALGISCDELLGDTKGYSDLSRYDLQRYLPYGLTLLALLLYYVFLKLQISQLLSFAAFLGMMVFSNVLMIQHTDKRALPSLTRWNLLLSACFLSAISVYPVSVSAIGLFQYTGDFGNADRGIPPIQLFCERL